MDFDLLDLYEALVELKQGKQPILKLPETKGRWVTITSEKQLLRLTLKAFARVSDLTDKVSRAGLTLLLPLRLRKRQETLRAHLGLQKALMILRRPENSFLTSGKNSRKYSGSDVWKRRILHSADTR